MEVIDLAFKSVITGGFMRYNDCTYIKFINGKNVKEIGVFFCLIADCLSQLNCRICPS